MRLCLSVLAACVALLLASCGTTPTNYGPSNMGGASVEMRQAKIAAEQTGSFYIGRRYHVNRTWFWGYLRKPREPWSKAQLVVFNQSRKRAPDNFPQNGPPLAHYAFDNNYQYRIWGHYTGQKVYEPNSNQFLPEFMLTNYQLLDPDPGWLFSPVDHYDPYRLTLLPR